MAAITSVGLNLEESWQAIKAGKSGIGPVTQFDTTGFATTIAGEVKNFDITQFITKKEARQMARFSQFAVAASKMAAEMAGLTEGNFNRERAGVFLGVGIGGFEVSEKGSADVLTKGPHNIEPLYIPKLIANEAGGNVAITLGLHGPNCAITTACSSGTDATVLAADAIRAGRVDIMFTGGAESTICKSAFAGFNKLMAMSTANEYPEKASRPFDKDRGGFVMGEGAGILILEDYDHAVARGANIICEYAGGAMTCDGYHLTAPSPDGRGATQAFKLALADAGLQPSDIGYINAHATGTPLNDPLESKVFINVFGEHATSHKLLISGSKSMLGHTLGAAGGIEAIVAIKALTEGFVPPTINLDNVDTEAGCTLNYVPKVGVKAELNAVMSDTLGFGGHNGVVCFKKV
ncbi:MAG: beta-ketoacyl-ACP synthase II [Spirochaetaceae bacterium]|nr:beta-ketoacyl-ACP synthase II [Spirochaetaceae bacterium]